MNSPQDKTATEDRFANYIHKLSQKEKLLPLLHTTDAYAFRDIVASGALNLTHCEIFGERLIYTFYGRPAYQPSNVKDATSLNAFSLISFIIEANRCPVPKRIFPFDTGAMRAGRYDNYMHPSMQMQNFALRPEMEEVGKFVKLFYGNNKNYYMGVCKQSVLYPVLEFEVQHYAEMIKERGKSKFDHRRNSVEVQFSEKIDLVPNDILAVVMPEPFWDDEEVDKFVCKTLRATPISYDCFHTDPDEDRQAIMQCVKKFFDERGLW